MKPITPNTQTLEDALMPQVSALQQSGFGISLAIELRDVPSKKGMDNIRNCVEQYLASRSYDYTIASKKNTLTNASEYSINIKNLEGPLSLRLHLQEEILGKAITYETGIVRKNISRFYIAADLGKSNVAESTMVSEIDAMHFYLSQRKDDLKKI